MSDHNGFLRAAYRISSPVVSTWKSVADNCKVDADPTFLDRDRT